MQEEALRRMHNSTLMIGEGLAVAMIWGIPSWLVFRAWRRYRRVDGVQLPLRIAISLLLVSEAMLVLVGIIVAVEITSMTTMTVGLQQVGVINFVLCAIALVTPFVVKTQDTAHVRRAVTAASIYLMFVWFYAMLAH